MKTILVVDDDRALRTLISVSLQANGHKVIDANSGVSGLEMARRHRPDLILSDIFMPGGDGSSLLRGVRLDPEPKSTLVVFMSGMLEQFAEPKDPIEKPDGFLAKPFTLQGLLSCLDAQFSRASSAHWGADNRIAA
jgi:CheY-like chemotaxis protein